MQYKVHMKEIKMLDCTLRDGGYVNNWQFGKKTIKSVLKGLDESGVDIMECGFISQKKSHCEDNTIFSTFFEPLNLLDGTKNATLVAMINYGEYNQEDVPFFEEGKTVDGVRIAFHKKDMVKAIEYSKIFKEKGYKLFIQPMVTQNYSDSELITLINLVNEVSPYAMYIVDSFGVMESNDVLRLFYIIDNNLSKSISIGFHSHNNLQLSFSNTQSLLSVRSNHHLIIDSSILGMGRGAGNLCTELLAQHLNTHHGSNYNMICILDVLDRYIAPLQKKYSWGYSIPYYIAAVNHCHPNYATYLYGKQTLGIMDINCIISKMDDCKKQFYDESYIESCYEDYQKDYIDDSVARSIVKKAIDNRDVLLIAPGNSIYESLQDINVFISDKQPIVIAINHVPSAIKTDYVFISNHRRLNEFNDILDYNNTIFTSNVVNDGPLSINYSDYICDDPFIIDNSGIMMLNFLHSLGISHVYIAGFDGFSLNRSENYYDQTIQNSAQSEYLMKTNKAISTQFTKMKMKIAITTLTETSYEL